MESDARDRCEILGAHIDARVTLRFNFLIRHGKTAESPDLPPYKAIMAKGSEEHLYSHTRDKTFQCKCCKRDVTPDRSHVVILCPGSHGDLVEINKIK